jgi:hypothetical protein
MALVMSLLGRLGRGPGADGLADVLTRLVVIYLGGRRLAAGQAAPAAAVPADARA